MKLSRIPHGEITVIAMGIVCDGQMHAVEAFMEIMPAGAPSGWD